MSKKGGAIGAPKRRRVDALPDRNQSTERLAAVVQSRQHIFRHPAAIGGGERQPLDGFDTISPYLVAIKCLAFQEHQAQASLGLNISCGGGQPEMGKRRSISIVGCVSQRQFQFWLAGGHGRDCHQSRGQCDENCQRFPQTPCCHFIPPRNYSATAARAALAGRIAIRQVQDRAIRDRPHPLYWVGLFGHLGKKPRRKYTLSDRRNDGPAHPQCRIHRGDERPSRFRLARFQRLHIPQAAP